MSSPRHRPGLPEGLTASDKSPAPIVFGFAKNRCAHIFFSVLSTKGLMTFSKIRFRKFLRNLIETYSSGSVLHRAATFPVGNYIFKVRDRSAEYVQG